MKTQNRLRGSTILSSKPIAVFAAIGMGLASTAPAYATIDNTASAGGTFGGNPVVSNDSTVNVPVITGDPDLNIAKTAALLPANDADGDGALDPGDTITYTFVVTNDGNVTMDDVVPVDAGPTFNNVAGTNSLSAFSPTEVDGLAPGATATFTATYTLSALDAYRAADQAAGDGVENSAFARGTPPGGGTYDDPDPDDAEILIPAQPGLQIAKTFVLNDEVTPNSLAEATETITYTYTITNTGNVPITNVSVTDTHEGAVIAATEFGGDTEITADPLGVTDLGTDTDDGIIDILGPGGVVTVTYVHTVTQDEVDDG